MRFQHAGCAVRQKGGGSASNVRAKTNMMAACLVLPALLLSHLPSSIHAATLSVNAAAGADSGDCVSSDCATVGYAFSQASAGDTIILQGSGTYAYDGNPAIVHGLTINGTNSPTLSLTSPFRPSGGTQGRDRSLTLTNLRVTGTAATWLEAEGTYDGVEFFGGSCSGGACVASTGPSTFSDCTFDSLTVSGQLANNANGAAVASFYKLGAPPTII